MTETEIAKIAYAQIIQAIWDLKSTAEEFGIINYPESIKVNGKHYIFCEIED